MPLTGLPVTGLADSPPALVPELLQTAGYALAAINAARPAEAILIRPDGYVAWAAGPDAPQEPGALRSALETWFGPPASRIR